MAVLTGGPDDDTIPGTADPDEISGEAGNDLITAGEGNDTIFGGDGADVIAGEAGDDWMDGGEGHDTFLPGPGNDTAYGGAGDDNFLYPFTDIRATYLWDGGDGDDTFVLLPGADGTVLGGAGEADRLFLYWNRTTLEPVHLDLTGATVRDQVLVIDGIEVFHVVTGSGNDTVTTGAGDDVVLLELGANIASTGDGDDVIGYSAGQVNHLDAGAGTDTLIVSQPRFGWSLDFDATGSEILDGFGSVLLGFERFHVSGAASADIARLGEADDRFRGLRGNDTAFGGAGDDRLSGGQNDDSLVGGDGNDRLAGGKGLDILEGGRGADAFRFDLDTTSDRIVDFETGIDRIRISTLFTGQSLLPGRLDAALLARDAATGETGQFVYRADGDDGLLLWDANGSLDGGETEILRLAGHVELAARDIILFF